MRMEETRKRRALQLGDHDAANDQRRTKQTLQTEMLLKDRRTQHCGAQRTERTEHTGALRRRAALRERLQRKAKATANERQRKHHRPFSAA